MHPFGMTAPSSDYGQFSGAYEEVTKPVKRAGAEVMDWIDAEREELADEELPHGADDFELTIERWLHYVKPQFRPFVYAWVAEISRHARVPVSASTLKKLRGMMRNDVDESAGILWDAKPEVIARWVSWYPDWIAGLVAERAASDPWFLLKAEDFRRKKLAQQTRDDTARKQKLADLKLGAALFKHGLDNGGLIHWRPGLLAQTLSGRPDRRGGKRSDPMKIAEAAAALVRLDVAVWSRRDNGKPWALRLTSPTLERSKTLH